MKNKFTKPILAFAALGVIGAGAGAGALASAQTAAPATTQASSGDTKGMGMHRMGGMGHHRGAAGVVTAVSGNMITVTGENGTTYTVDASGAKVSKIVELSVSDIKVGDRIGAHGTLSGTTITAEHIMDGIPAKPAIVPASN